MASLVSAILTSATELEREEILFKLSRLTSEVAHTKEELYDQLQNKYKDLLPMLPLSDDYTHRLQTLSEDISELNDVLENEIQSQLNVSTREFQTVSQNLAETNAILAVLERLVQLDHGLSTFCLASGADKYSSAASALVSVKALLPDVPEDVPEMTILHSVHSEYCRHELSLIMDLDKFWKANVMWTINDNNNDASSMQCELSVTAGEKAISELADAIKAMDRLGLLHVKLRTFGDIMIQHLLEPLIKDNRMMAIIQEPVTDRHIIKLVPDTKKKKKGKNMVDPINLFKQIVEVLVFLDEHLLNITVDVEGHSRFDIAQENSLRETTTCNVTNQVSLLEMIGCMCADKFIAILIKDALSVAVPTQSKDLESFKDVLNATLHFHEHLVNMKFCPTTSVGLRDFVENINVRFASKKCQEIIVKARNLMTSEIHNMKLITPEKPLGDLPVLADGKPQRQCDSLATQTLLKDSIFQFPKCYISSCVEDLMSLAYDTLHEATQSSPECATQLFFTARNIFELFCSVFPTYHKQSLATLPQLAALQYNNCMFLAHHLMTLGHQVSRKLPGAVLEHCTFVDLVVKVRTPGMECFMEQMRRQKAQLLECLHGDESFSAASGESAVKQVTYQLKHLQKVWQDVLPPLVYSKAMGTLLNTVISEMTNAIIVLEDISEDDATVFHGLLSAVKRNATGLIISPEGDVKTSEAALQRYVLSWMRFNELILMLKAGLLEIADRWSEGNGPLAHVFTVTEVKQLIRALFQNTDRRAAVLARIG